MVEPKTKTWKTMLAESKDGDLRHLWLQSEHWGTCAVGQAINLLPSSDDEWYLLLGMKHVHPQLYLLGHTINMAIGNNNKEQAVAIERNIAQYVEQHGGPEQIRDEVYSEIGRILELEDKYYKQHGTLPETNVVMKLLAK